MKTLLHIFLLLVLATPVLASPLTIGLFDGFQGRGDLTPLANELQRVFGATVAEFSDFQTTTAGLTTAQINNVVNFFAVHPETQTVVIGHSRGGEEAAILGRILHATILIQLDPVYSGCELALAGVCPQSLPPGIGHAFNYHETTPGPALYGNYPITGAVDVDVFRDLGLRVCHTTGDPACPAIYSQAGGLWGVLEDVIRTNLPTIPTGPTIPEPATWILLGTVQASLYFLSENLIK